MSDNRRIIDDQLYCHFVTFSCHRRRRLLDEDHPKRILLGQLNEQLDRQQATCVGFVVMPDHVHLMVWFPETGQLSRFMHSWKRTSSYRIREWYRQEQANYFTVADEGDRFWTPKYYSFEIHSRAKLEEKLIYMHQNPVRAGLVEQAIDWKWSSARWYELGRSVGVPIRWIE
ncbi:MAG: transposase [Planctomycetaceae bacterium]|nr:transposase [Planctomycetaceae bacterium]